MINTFIKNYKERRFGKTWQQVIQTKYQKELQVHAAAITADAQVMSKGNVPVHPPHIVFDRAYVNKTATPELAELAKAHEAVRHLEFHDHSHQVGFAY